MGMEIIFYDSELAHIANLHWVYLGIVDAA